MDFFENSFKGYYVFTILFNRYRLVTLIIRIIGALIINILFKFYIKD